MFRGSERNLPRRDQCGASDCVIGAGALIMKDTEQGDVFARASHGALPEEELGARFLMLWSRQGILLSAPIGLDWAMSHAALPVPLSLGESRIRLFFSARDAPGRSRSVARSSISGSRTTPPKCSGPRRSGSGRSALSTTVASQRPAS